MDGIHTYKNAGLTDNSVSSCSEARWRPCTRDRKWSTCEKPIFASEKPTLHMQRKHSSSSLLLSLSTSLSLCKSSTLCSYKPIKDTLWRLKKRSSYHAFAFTCRRPYCFLKLSLPVCLLHIWYCLIDQCEITPFVFHWNYEKFVLWHQMWVNGSLRPPRIIPPRFIRKWDMFEQG